ncbi:MAG: alpha-L-fucosidase [Candidatus Brocadiia bacterium]
MMESRDELQQLPEHLRKYVQRARWRQSRENYWTRGRFEAQAPDPAHEERVRWFREGRCGLMMHMGLYTVLGRNEWAVIKEGIPWDEYEALADRWRPREGVADEWLSDAAAMGARYAIFSTKHHEGFCLWDTETTDFNSAARGPGRDFVAEYVKACRRRDIRVGLYFSLWDVHHPATERAREDESARRELVDYTHAQIEELCTRYGRIDLLWYDVPKPLNPDGWEHETINSNVREWQPGILINDRMGVPGDFATQDFGVRPDQELTPGEPCRDWEVAFPVNGKWLYNEQAQRDCMSLRTVLRILAETTAHVGAMAVNVGPKPDGSFPAAARGRLHELGRWLARYGEAVYGPKERVLGRLPATGLGQWTLEGKTAYLWLFEWPGPGWAITNFAPEVERATLLPEGPEVTVRHEDGRVVFPALPVPEPDPETGVAIIKLELAEELEL